MLKAFQQRTFQGWYWVLVPLLAILAYASVLGIGFLSDDFILLSLARHQGVSLSGLLPDPIWPGYRLVGAMVTWRLGWQWWGSNPLPYHLLGLFLHAGTSLLLGLWLAEVSGRRALGWLAGALFAVFPLHMEAVGWLAAQWDSWAAFFGVASLWVFSRWWRSARSGGLYAFSLLTFALGVFSKESLLTFLPMWAISAWLVGGGIDKGRVRRLAYALLPFCAILAVNLGLRFVFLHSLASYGQAQEGYTERLPDKLANYIGVLLSPVNKAMFGSTTSTVVSAVTGVCLLLALVFLGRRYPRLLLAGGAWILLALLPVLNLPVAVGDLENNRFMYLLSAGYCTIWAVLLYSSASMPRFRYGVVALVSVLLLLCAVTCWAQLAPWRVATVQATELEREMIRLVPPPLQPRPQGMVWYTENVPDNYRGAYVFRLGFGGMRALTLKRDEPFIEKVSSASEADITDDERDAFALRFFYDGRDNLFHTDYAAGVTSGVQTPATGEMGDGFLLWDFRSCEQGTQGWQVIQAQVQCAKGKGLSLESDTGDAQMAGPSLDLGLQAGGARFLRLRVSVLYPATSKPLPYIGQWFWKGQSGGWSEEQSRMLPIKQDGKAHVYWTFIPAADAGDTITGLRFDPVNGKVPAEVQWIAVDLVK